MKIGQHHLKEVKPVNSVKLRDVNNFNSFTPQKLNFHKSGVVTNKNKAGARIHQDDQSIKFSKIKDAATLFAYRPMQPSCYPKITDRVKHYYDLINSNPGVLPPNIQVVLKRPNHDIIDHLNRSLNFKNSYLFVSKDILKDHDLELCIIVRKASQDLFPECEGVAVVEYDT